MLRKLRLSVNAVSMTLDGVYLHLSQEDRIYVHRTEKIEQQNVSHTNHIMNLAQQILQGLRMFYSLASIEKSPKFHTSSGPVIEKLCTGRDRDS